MSRLSWESTVENVRVLSMGDLVVPAFAGPCLDSDLLSLAGPAPDFAAVDAGGGEAQPRRTRLEPPGPGPVRRLLTRLESMVRPFDAGARILLIGLLGFLAVLLLETTVTALALGFRRSRPSTPRPRFRSPSGRVRPPISPRHGSSSSRWRRC